MKCDKAREDLVPGGVAALPPAAAGRRRRMAQRVGAAAVPLATLAVAVLVAAVALVALAPAARADGDPGSDVLVNQDLFVAADAGVPVQQQVQLGDLLRQANRSGFAIRVAIIAKPDDLGAVTALWRKPAAYARFLGIELSLAYKQRLLVVMPDGFGFNWPGHPAAPAGRLLAKVPVGAGGNGLARATGTALRRLAAAAGVKLSSRAGATAAATPAPGGNTAGSGAGLANRPRTAAASSGGVAPLTVAVVVAMLVAAGVLATWLVLRRHPRRPLGTDAPTRNREPAPPRRRRRLVMSGALVLVVGFAAATAYVLTRRPGPGAGQALRPSGIPASISTSLANQMALDSLPRKPAPEFTLTDQAGRSVSLASLRGKVVVLEFMDDHCYTICPIVSQEFVYAYHDLGPLAGKVVFAAVNVNPFYRSVHDVAAFTAEHQLATIPEWHYFTGSLPALRAIWRAYGITVTAPNRHDVIHTSAIYIIDPRGRERYLADADVEEPAVRYHSNGDSYIPGGAEPAWGRGIARLVRSLVR